MRLSVFQTELARNLTGILYMFTGGLFGIGYVYDTLTLNEQVEEVNAETA